MEGYHKSVLSLEAIDALSIRDAWYLDCTLGDGGHSIEIISRGGKVVGIDVDPQALERVQNRFEDLGIEKDKFKLIQGNFRDAKNLIFRQSGSKFAGAIFDLGVSSLQLKSPERGFSFGKDGPLDMRMDPTLQVRALDLINILSGKELYELFKTLGEEKYSKRLADALVLARQVKSFTTTVELATEVGKIIGKKREKINPATRVFQALRIAVNDELNALREGLEAVKELIEKNGYIVVISFHSLEERITKLSFRDWGKKGEGVVITKKPIVPSFGEVTENPRSRSAKMRVFKIL